jgi:hypothetical protein
VASYKPDGRTLWGARWQTWDSSFGVDTRSVTLSQFVSKGRTLTKTYTATAQPSFFDAAPGAYYDPSIPWASVMTAGSGLKIDIVGASADRGTYRLHVYR